MDRKEKLRLTALPKEVLILTFEAQSTVKDTFHFARTCRILYDIWRSKCGAISDTIFSREIMGYNLAKGLLTGLSQKTRPLNFIKDIYTLYKDAPLILDHAGKHFAKLTTLEESEIYCPIHSDSSGQGRSLMEHERLRTLWSWYFLKLFTQSYGPNHRWQRDVLDAVLADTSLLQNVVLFDMVTFLCEDLDPEVQDEAGISDPDPPEELIDVQANIQLPDWAETRRNVTDDFGKKKGAEWISVKKRLMGPCDVCQIKWRGGPCCSPRDPKKGLWEL